MMVMHVRMRAGLLEPKHVQAMGGCPLTLYLWLHTRVRFKGEGAGTTFPDQPYRHQDAADALGVKRDRIRDWFEALVRGGYVTTRRLRHGLEVTISKYGAPAQSEENPPPLINKGEENPPPATPQSGEKTTPRVGKKPHPSRENPPLSQIAIQESTREIQTPIQGDAPPAPPKPLRPNKVAAVIDALRAADQPDVLSGYDKTAVAKCDAPAQTIVEAFLALNAGEWGSQWVRENASIAVVANNIGTYLNQRKNGAPPPARASPGAGRKLTGQDYLTWRRQQVRAEREGTGGHGGEAEGLRRLPGGAVDADYRPLPPDRAR